MLNLPVTTNGTAWLRAGHNVYVLVGAGGFGGQGFPQAGVQGYQARQPPPVGAGQQGQGPGPQGYGSPWSGPRNGIGPGGQMPLNVTGGTLLYKGAVYSLYVMT